MILTKVSDLVLALEKGRELDNVEAWKTSGVLGSVVTSGLSLLSAIAASAGWFAIDDQTLVALSSILVSLVTAFVSYVQIATTQKIGIKNKLIGE